MMTQQQRSARCDARMCSAHANPKDSFAKVLARAAFLVLAWACLSACSTIDKPFLYEATQGEKKIRLFGTMHAGVPGWDLPKSVVRSLKESDQAYFESTNMVDGKRPKRQVRGTPKIGSSLKRELGPEKFATLCEILAPASPDRVDELPPSVALSLAIAKFPVMVSSYKARSMKFENGLDYELLRTAREFDIPTEGLDTESYDLCSDDIEKGSLDELKSFLAQPSSEYLRSRVESMIEDYRSGDEARVASTPDLEDDNCILQERNMRWANLLEKNVKPGQKNFVVVGVAHLVPGRGIQSLLDQLRSRGYQVRRIEE